MCRRLACKQEREPFEKNMHSVLDGSVCIATSEVILCRRPLSPIINTDRWKVSMEMGEHGMVNSKVNTHPLREHGHSVAY